MDRDQQARELCETGLQHMWRGEVEPALELYTRALDLAADDELREVITIRKAEALIAADQEGPEVSALAQIVMRRRSPRHVYMAATVLLRRNAIIAFMGVELMLNAANLAFVGFSNIHGTVDGQVMAFVVMVVAAAEVVVGLAIIVAIFRARQSVSLDDPSELKG